MHTSEINQNFRKIVGLKNKMLMYFNFVKNRTIKSKSSEAFETISYKR